MNREGDVSSLLRCALTGNQARCHGELTIGRYFHDATMRIVPAGAEKRKSGAEKRKSGAVKRKSGAEKRKSGAEKRKSGAEKRKSGAVKRKSGAEKRKSGAEKRKSGAEKRKSGAEKRNCTLGPPYTSSVLIGPVCYIHVYILSLEPP